MANAIATAFVILPLLGPAIGGRDRRLQVLARHRACRRSLRYRQRIADGSARARIHRGHQSVRSARRRCVQELRHRRRLVGRRGVRPARAPGGGCGDRCSHRRSEHRGNELVGDQPNGARGRRRHLPATGLHRVQRGRLPGANPTAVSVAAQGLYHGGRGQAEDAGRSPRGHLERSRGGIPAGDTRPRPSTATPTTSPSCCDRTHPCGSLARSRQNSVARTPPPRSHPRISC